MQFDPNQLPPRIAQNTRYLEGHWIWVGRKSKNGYGRIYFDGREHQIHRLVYQLFVKPIGASIVLDHTCQIKACCNPACLQPVSGKRNTQLAIERDPERARQQRVSAARSRWEKVRKNAKR